MPKKNHKKADPLSTRLKVQVTGQEAEAIAKRAGGPRCASGYLRGLALADIQGAAPKQLLPRRIRHQEEMVARLIALCAELRRIGNNINQLAHQANAKVVPITRDEAAQLLVSHAHLIATVELAIQEVLP